MTKLSKNAELQQSCIAAVISRLFPLKFKVRVSHFEEQYYTVDYCNYRIFPIWRSLMSWFEQGHPGGTETWYKDLFDFKTAERIAGSLFSIKDVELFHEKDIENAKNWKIVESEFRKRNVPYKTKRF